MIIKVEFTLLLLCKNVNGVILISHSNYYCFCLIQEHCAAHQEKKSSNNRQFEAVTPAEDLSLPDPPSGCSSSSTTQQLTLKALPTVTAGFPQPSAPPFLFPIPRFPPSLPPVPPRLPDGTIPIPPPGWMPPLGHKAAIPIPPPPLPPRTPIPPPPIFLRPPPPLIAPPSVPLPVHMFPLPIQPGCPLDKGNPPRHGGPPLPFPPPPPLWPAPPFPRFNPFVPPPLYPPVQANPHKITTEKVLDILMDELKSIIKKDITRRMIEGVAFKAFEDWWECQEKKAKVKPFSHTLLSLIVGTLTKHFACLLMGVVVWSQWVL